MAMTGMDITQVRTLAKLFQSEAEQINQIISKISGQLGSTQWLGPDATQFHNDWNGQYSSALRNVANELTQASNSATRNANEQEQAAAH